MSNKIDNRIWKRLNKMDEDIASSDRSPTRSEFLKARADVFADGIENVAFKLEKINFQLQQTINAMEDEINRMAPQRQAEIIIQRIMQDEK